jgi:hypothetical protein
MNEALSLAARRKQDNYFSVFSLPGHFKKGSAKIVLFQILGEPFIVSL